MIKPVIEINGKTYDVTGIRYYDGVATDATYYDEENQFHTVYDIRNSLAPEGGVVIDFNENLLWDGRNDLFIAKVARLLEGKTSQWNEIAHEIVEGSTAEIDRARRDDYYTLTGEVAALHEVMKLVK